MIEEGLFSDSASRDWAGSFIGKTLEEQTEKTKQMSELQKMKTEQKKIDKEKERNNVQLKEKERNNFVDVILP